MNKVNKDTLGVPLFEQKPKVDSRSGPRIQLRPLHNCSFLVKAASEELPLINISIGGLGFSAQGLQGIPDIIEGSLILAHEQYFVHLSLVHRSDQLVGYKFSNLDKTLVSAIQKYFEAEITGMSLTKLQLESEGVSRNGITVYKGINNCEIFLQTRENDSVDASIILFGSYYEIKDGQLREGGVLIQDNNTRKGVSVFRQSIAFNPDMKRVLLRFIESVDLMPLEHREALARVIKQDLSR